VETLPKATVEVDENCNFTLNELAKKSFFVLEETSGKDSV
jgi:hypothetical protein